MPILFQPLYVQRQKWFLPTATQLLVEKTGRKTDYYNPNIMQAYWPVNSNKLHEMNHPELLLPLQNCLYVFFGHY